MKIVPVVLFVALLSCGILVGSAVASTDEAAPAESVAMTSLEVVVPLALGAGLLAVARVAGRRRRR